MNVLITEHDDDADEELAEARDEAAAIGWDIIETAGGFCAVPHGVELVFADDPSSLMEKLTARPPLIDAPAPTADRYQEISLVRDPDDIGSGG